MSKYTFCSLSYQYSKKFVLASNYHIKGALLDLKLHPIGKARRQLHSWGMWKGREKMCLLAKVYSIVLEQVILVLDSMYCRGQTNNIPATS